MYNNPYISNYSTNYNPQQIKERIDNQMAQLQQMKDQIPNAPVQPTMPTNLTQNFQIAPANNNIIKYASSMEEVQRNMVIGDTPFFSNDMSVVWIKNAKGEIKTYELNEIVQKDEKDLQIEFLMAQVNELKGMIKNESNANVDEPVAKPIKEQESTNVSTVRATKKK